MTIPEPAGRPRTRRVLIVDDEPLARDCMRLALAQAADTEIVAECADGESAVQAIRQHAPDVVLLDVQMPGIDGFGVIDAVGVDAMPAVVFVTAFDAHAIRAFQVHALGYVLKPFDDDALVAAVDHAYDAVRTRAEGELARRLAGVLRSWEGGAGNHELDDDAPDAAVPGAPARATYITRFAVREDGRVRYVAANDVDWIEADGNYIALHVGDARHRIRAALREVIADLDPRRFVRAHRSTIVNIERIRELQPWFGGDYVAIMCTGVRLKVSRQRVSELLRPMA